MSNLVDVKIHGILGKQLGKSEWKLKVRSVGDAVRGIQCNSKKLYSQLLENDKKNIRYRVLINNKDFLITNLLIVIIITNINILSRLLYDLGHLLFVT